MKVDDQPQVLGAKRPHPNGPGSSPPNLKAQALAEPTSDVPVRALLLNNDVKPSLVASGAGVAEVNPPAARVEGMAGSATTGVSNGARPEGAGARLKPGPRVASRGPDVLQILEVTNDGDPANMEMLIHLKVRRANRIQCTGIVGAFGIAWPKPLAIAAMYITVSKYVTYAYSSKKLACLYTCVIGR